MSSGTYFEDEDGRKVTAAGLDAKYNDNVDYHVTYHGHDLHITDNVYLYNSQYQIGLGQDYKNLLNNIGYGARLLDKTFRL